MNWRDLLFWRPAPIVDVKSLADFIDNQSAFLVQKGMYEYSRARAGHYSKVLFSEPEFLDALERSRWAAFPLGLAMVGEVVEGILRPHTPDRVNQLEKLGGLVLSVFDRYAEPALPEQHSWGKARAELANRLQQVGLHPPKRAMDIPVSYAKTYWNLMPIAKEVRSADLPTTRNYLMVTMCNIHEDLFRRIDAPAVARQLAEGALPVAANAQSAP